MNIRIKKSKGITILGAVSVVAVLVFAFFFTHLQSRSDTVMAQQEGVRFITVYDRGEKTSFMTEAKTIAEALSTAGVSLDERDAVEPARDETLVASEYTVNIYRARPVTVVDGVLKKKVFTPYQSSERIANDAGVVLFPEDELQLERADEGYGLQLEVIRAVPFSFTLYGAESTARTQAKTVGGMLKAKGVQLGKDDRVTPAPETSLTEGLVVRVWREGKQTVTVDEAVEFEVEKIQDADQRVGYKQVKTPGVNGERSVTYEIIIKDGQEVSRQEIASVIRKEATTQVEVVGTKPEYLPYSGGGTKTQWLTSSNIPESMWGYADFMVQKESGWNPNARNKSSGACGLAQALPCSKVGGDPLNPVNSLNWMNGYVNGRYGGWEGAYTFWQKNRWY